jgi:hypothetical protein
MAESASSIQMFIGSPEESGPGNGTSLITDMTFMI